MLVGFLARVAGIGCEMLGVEGRRSCGRWMQLARPALPLSETWVYSQRAGGALRRYYFPTLAEAITASPTGVTCHDFVFSGGVLARTMSKVDNGRYCGRWTKLARSH